MNEFDIIKRYLTPLASDRAALGLQDDAAIISGPDGKDWVVAKDAIVEAVHFFPDTAPDKIAQKLLRVNLSDIAAMGAAPRYYLVTAMLSDVVDEAWVEAFTDTLKREQELFEIALLGGDTVRTPGPLSLSLTMIGEIEKGKALLRSAAQVGDIIYVSGTIGDAALGLAVLGGEMKEVEIQTQEFLISRYHIPEPRVELGKALAGVANAVTDISDGLIADVANICSASGVGAELYKEKIPLSSAAQGLLEQSKAWQEKIITGGDDYELVFTVPETQKDTIEVLSQALQISITEIGRILPQDGVKFLDQSGAKIPIKNPGFSHS